MKAKKERYDNLDGFRAISCFCIVAYHIKKYSDYQLSGIGAEIVDSWTNFVPLFLLISGFGMFCGYYHKIKEHKVDLNTFYTKRYKKILPFFACVLLIDVIVERSISHIIEALTEVTLVFGLLPNNKLNVCGVGWTLGVIFLFYMLFPYFVFLCNTKNRAIISFLISIVLSLFCVGYFCSDEFVINFTPRHNFLYCAPYFLGGAVTYLFRNEIRAFMSKNKYVSLGVCIFIIVAWYILPTHIGEVSVLIVKNLFLFIPWLWYAISNDSIILSNSITKHFSAISLEMYLIQMVFYRITEKVFGLYFAGRGWVGFILVWIIVMVEIIVFVEIWKVCYGLISRKLFQG